MVGLAFHRTLGECLVAIDQVSHRLVMDSGREKLLLPLTSAPILSAAASPYGYDVAWLTRAGELVVYDPNENETRIRYRPGEES